MEISRINIKKSILTLFLIMKFPTYIPNFSENNNFLLFSYHDIRKSIRESNIFNNIIIYIKYI